MAIRRLRGSRFPALAVALLFLAASIFRVYGWDLLWGGPHPPQDAQRPSPVMSEMIYSLSVAALLYLAVRLATHWTCSQEENRLKETLSSARRYHSAFAEGPELAAIVSQADERIVDANAAFLRTIGRTRASTLGQTIDQLGFHFVPQIPLASLVSEPPFANEVAFTSQSEGERIGLATVVALSESEPACLLFLVSDVSEKRKLEAEFHQAQKMETVGRLASAVAHDFNNLLQVILGYASVVRARLDADHVHTKAMDQIIAAAKSGAQRTSQLLAFGRKSPLVTADVNVNHVVVDTLKLCHHLLGKDVAVEQVLADEPWIVRTDVGLLQQALMNLLINARDAMPQGGRVSLRTANCQRPRSKSGGAHGGACVLLEVSDTGSGMTPETLAHAFEPFFTTKERGKGTGLGLAMVYGFVKQSGGSIELKSELGKGTTFTVYLPRKGSRKTERLPLPPFRQTPPKGHETILLAEDDTAIREMLRDGLQHAGYTVVEAGDGSEALEKARQLSGPIHLLLSDHDMPRLRGMELYEALKTQRPELRALFLTGCPETDKEISSRETAVSILTKPITPQVLLLRIREILDAGHRPKDAAGAEGERLLSAQDNRRFT